MSNDIRLIQLSNYIKPKLEENKAKNWVLNGKNNSFYQYVIDRFNGSPTNSAIINSYIDLIYGRGLSAYNKNTTQWIEFVSKMNPKELRKIITDFELFGEASFQVIKAKNKKDLGSIYHLPKEQVVPSLENEDGEILSYWHCKDWSNTNKNKPVEYSAFGTSNDEIEIYCIRPYKAGKNYFSDPDYIACMPYAEMEEELSNFYINSIKKGLSAGYIIDIVDGGIYTQEQKEELENKIKQKLTGSPNAMNFIINFKSGVAEINIVPFPVNDAQHKQWEYLTAEARQQIMTGHRVVSPMLFGIKDSTGFGNNADELDTAEAQLMKRIIAPKQSFIVDALKDVLEHYNINLDLYFLPLTEQKSGVNTNLSTQVCCSNEKKNLDSNVADELISLGTDSMTNEWELVETKVVTDIETDLHFANTGIARPNAKDSQDGELFKSRYRYIGELSSNSREFCTKMINANKLYRLSDINAMSNKVVNEGWGPNGADTYDILLYKGGGACRHAWQRETYRLKADVNSPNAEQITPSQARKEGEILPTIDKKAYQKPNDMPNRGFLNK